MRFIRNGAVVGMAVAAAVVLLGFPELTKAQSVTLKVMIPFEFHVGGQTLPAGSYTVRNVGEVLRISDGGGHIATVLSIPVSGPSTGSRSAVVFNQYGNEYFLKEARWEGYKNARGLLRSKGELELATATAVRRMDLAAVVQ